MKIDAERLRGFLDCMHEEADERDKRSAQIRDIVKAAKDAGYDTKAIRKVFVRERMDEAERSKQDDLLETYEAALGGKGRALAAIAAGVPVGEAAAANGVHRATVARARHVANQTSNATPHDPKTGEVRDDVHVQHDSRLGAKAAGSDLDSPDVQRISGDHPPVEGDRREVGSSELQPEQGRVLGADRGEVGCHRKESGDARPCGEATEAKASLTVEMGHPASSTDAPPDDLEIPPHLDRRHELARP